MDIVLSYIACSFNVERDKSIFMYFLISLRECWTAVGRDVKMNVRGKSPAMGNRGAERHRLKGLG